MFINITLQIFKSLFLPHTPKTLWTWVESIYRIQSYFTILFEVLNYTELIWNKYSMQIQW